MVYSSIIPLASPTPPRSKVALGDYRGNNERLTIIGCLELIVFLLWINILTNVISKDVNGIKEYYPIAIVYYRIFTNVISMDSIK